MPSHKQMAQMERLDAGVMQTLGLQAQLAIAAPGDKYEQEAEQAATQVVGQISTPQTQQQSVQRQAVPDAEAKEGQMQLLGQQRSNDSGLASEGVESAIEAARGQGQPLGDEVRGPMEQAFGTDFGRVRVHTDSQSDQLNESVQAQAFTTGQDIFFRQGEYQPASTSGQALLAHELTHVLQQTSTIQPQIQRYQVQGGYRVSDDGQMGVHQKSTTGGQTAYATPDLIQNASQKLKAATSTIALKPGTMSGELAAIDGQKHKVVDVVPVNTVNKTEDLDMELWADCGRSAKTVSGMDQGTGQGNASPGAQYNKQNKSKTVAGNDWMEIQKVKIFVDLFSEKSSWWEFWKPKYESKLDLKTISKKLAEYKKIKQDWAAETDEAASDVLARQMAVLASELDVLARVEYEKLDPDAKDEFDKKTGINMYADPEIGEAFHISTGGNEHPGKPANVGTWNFHWAGVVMKTGADTLTLENYSVSDYEEQNKEWVFQMYGVGKKGQSFHEEHKDVHKQHGDAPTSMVAVRRFSQGD